MEFKEEQKLKLWWLYVLIGLELIVLAPIMFLSKHRITLAELKDMHYVPLLSFVLPMLAVWLINNIKFNFEIDKEGISYRYFSITGKRTIIPWTSIKKAYIRKYDALGEYGGWGAKNRLWFKLNDKAYIFNDHNKGLQLELKNGKKILFSSNKVEEMELFLFNLKTMSKIEALSDRHV